MNFVLLAARVVAGEVNRADAVRERGDLIL